VVAEVGAGVQTFTVGDEVLGFTNQPASQAEFVVVSANQLSAKPPAVSWEVAGALFVAGTTAYAAVRAVGLRAGDTLAVTGAAGGVGSIAVQLVKRSGATVLGVAGPSNDEWLSRRFGRPIGRWNSGIPGAKLYCARNGDRTCGLCQFLAPGYTFCTTAG
jgi:NADPH:quinone reductase-like Zn-dependent oxidoreductase